MVGGRDRRRVIVVLASVLALDSADKATLGTSATQLQASLNIGTAQIGLLLAVGSAVGAVASVPAGMLVDRVDRTRLLALAILGWGVAMALSAAATDYLFLLLSRLGLGVVTAVAGPAVASLIGDFFPQRDRGRIYGFVLAGELVGSGFGFAVAGQFAVLSWRAPFLVLLPPTALVWWLVHRLPEPERGGAGALPSATGGGAPRDEDERRDGIGLAGRMARRESIPPRQEAVLHRPPESMSLWQAVRHVLRVRTNLVLIVSSALGYFFFSGLRGFAVEFAKHHYRIPQSLATTLTLVVGVGALAGVLSGGRLADRLLRSGRIPARVEVAGTSVLAAACVFVPAILTDSVAVAVPLLILASFFLGAANPPLDAARLDIMHPRLWGRAEAIRTVLRNAGDAVAPLLFGVLAATVFSGGSGLEFTFLVMLSTLVAAALVTLLIGRRTYPRDVAAAAELVDRFPPIFAERNGMDVH
jgi:predicted MFS family arabinose efflux permease